MIKRLFKLVAIIFLWMLMLITFFTTPVELIFYVIRWVISGAEFLDEGELTIDLIPAKLKDMISELAVK